MIMMENSDEGLERLIITAMTGRPWPPAPGVAEEGEDYGSSGWLHGRPEGYNRAWCADLFQLTAFLCTTQPTLYETLDLANDSPIRRAFLARLFDETGRRGVIDVLRHGIRHGRHEITLFYGAPNADGARREENRFSVTRQLRYSLKEPMRALNMVIFINGLPIATFELRNGLNKQTVNDAIEQCRQRDPREPLFAVGRCAVHFALDDSEVWICTELKGGESRFLPFNKGWNGGAGNPPNPLGLKTDYLWRELLTAASLSDIVAHYAHSVEEIDLETGRTQRRQLFPRYHQLEVVRALLADATAQGVGQRYLIQHAAGGGTSHSIAWLAQRLTAVRRGDVALFDTLIVVSARHGLAPWIEQDHAESARDMSRFIAAGGRIITAETRHFSAILDEIEHHQRKRNVAIIIDERCPVGDSGETAEELINAALEMRKLPDNSSCFVFCAAPNERTLALFGTAARRPFHSYPLKQAIQEGAHPPLAEP